MTSEFKPMLAGKAGDLRFPLLASPKVDGVRATVLNARLHSRSLKPFANLHTQELFSSAHLSGLDGEFILGDPTAKDVCRRTTQALATISGAPQLTLYVFDDWSFKGGFAERLEVAGRRVRALGVSMRIKPLHHELVKTQSDLDQLEYKWTEAGYEGVMVRDPFGPYKFGRSTTNEGWLLKVKRYEDAEAEVIGIEEEMHNGNVAETNELGRTKRSSAAAGKTGKGTMGALVVRGTNGQFEGVEFNIGTGFTAADRARTDWLGKIVKYKYFPVGVKDKPRHPVYLACRMPEDMS